MIHTDDESDENQFIETLGTIRGICLRGITTEDLIVSFFCMSRSHLLHPVM
uniref:Uncharacterized protein n=1 Tax=Kalanchoe fedtschenkoi TaxID=63787 RepID=A0A7N0ZT43_KALFE